MPFEIGQLVRKTCDGFLINEGELCTVLRYSDNATNDCIMLVRIESSCREHWANPDKFELVGTNSDDINSFMSDF